MVLRIIITVCNWVTYVLYIIYISIYNEVGLELGRKVCLADSLPGMNKTVTYIAIKCVITHISLSRVYNYINTYGYAIRLHLSI